MLRLFYRKLTLIGIQRVGKDGTLFPTQTTLAYETSRGTAKRANGGWNRLKTINNGQGGTLTFGYQHISQVYFAASPQPTWYNVFFNRHRVSSRTLTDGRGNSYLTTYSYGPAAVNSLGSDNGGRGPNQFPNSATLVNADKENALALLAVGREREFRGHAVMVERHYAKGTATAAELLQTIEHAFFQGDVGCTPLDNKDTDACFVQLRDREALKGREWRTRWLDGAGLALRQVNHTFDLQWYLGTVYDYTLYPRHGLWRVFSFESQTDERTCEGTYALCDDPATPLTPLLKITQYLYDPAYQSGGVQYGNLTRILEYNGATLLRDTRRQHATRDLDSWSGSAPTPSYSVGYLVDRVWQEATFDGAGQRQAISNTFYDNTSSATTAPTLGDVRRVSRVYDIPLGDPTGLTLHTQDSTSTYDSYGNRLTTTSYAGAGTWLYNGSVTSWSAPGSGSAARTSTTSYDDPSTTLNESFSGLPTQLTNPLSQSERAAYDYRMGALLRVTGPNTSGTPTNCAAASYTLPATEASSCAQYDVFGRMVKLVRPGDSTSYPTLLAAYADSEQPFRYRLDRRETAGSANVRIEQQFYDGLGRQIQTKQEGPQTNQNIIVDSRYDALNRATAQ
ncbi:MAG: toxin TcdB middle/N-terminal domain-containing protein, partial [Roseiflexaceae bacterium]